MNWQPYRVSEADISNFIHSSERDSNSSMHAWCNLVSARFICINEKKELGLLRMAMRH